MRKKTGYIRAHGNGWEIAYYDINHTRQFERFTSEEEAHAQLAQRLAEVAHGLPVSSRPNTVKFGELCDDVVTDYEVNQHKSVDDIEARYRLHIVPVFGQRKAVQITTAHIKRYIVSRLAEDASPGTVKRELEAIARAFNLAIKEGKLFHAPRLPEFQADNIRQGFFTREEVERLCSHLKKPLDSLVMFAFLTGWRLEEVRGLQWKNVDFDAGEIRLDPGTTKNGKGRAFPMTDELRGLLKRLSKPPAVANKSISPEIAPRSIVPVVKVTAITAGYVFTKNGRQVGAFRKSWKTANHKAGLPCVVEPIKIRGKLQKRVKVISAERIFHDLRRSAARYLISKGLTEKQVMEYCGWETRSMFDRYSVLGKADFERARDLLNGGRNGGKSGSSER